MVLLGPDLVQLGPEVVLLGLEVVEPGPERVLPGPEMVLPGPEVVDTNISGSEEHVTESCRSIHSPFLDLAVAKSLQSTRMVTDADADADDDDDDV